MTPREKAIRMYEKLRNTSPVTEANYRSKNRAIIMVDEMIELMEDVLKPFISEQQYSAHLFYFQEVKKEIQKL